MEIQSRHRIVDTDAIADAVCADASSEPSTNRRKPKGDGQKKRHDNLRQTQAVWARESRVGSLSEPGAVTAPKCDPLREVSENSPSQRAACRQLPSPRGRYHLPCAEVRVPLREVVRGQPSHHNFEVVFSQLLREDICQGHHQSRDS